MFVKLLGGAVVSLVGAEGWVIFFYDLLRFKLFQMFLLETIVGNYSCWKLLLETTALETIVGNYSCWKLLLETFVLEIDDELIFTICPPTRET